MTSNMIKNDINESKKNDSCDFKTLNRYHEQNDEKVTLEIALQAINLQNKNEISIERNRKPNILTEKQNQPKKRLLIVGSVGILLLIIACLTLAISPVARIIDAEMMFAEGTELFSFWMEPPVTVYIKTHVFNVTNHLKFLAGEEKLKVKELEPFYYRETIRMRNVTFNDNGTVTYVPERELFLVREMSSMDPDTTRIIVPNVPLIGIASMMHDASFVTNMGLSSLISYLDTQAFINLSVTEFLMGYDDPLVQLAGTLIPSWIPFKRFGILERLFGDGLINVTMNIKPAEHQPMGVDNEPDYRGQYLVDTFNADTEIPGWVSNVPKRRIPNRCTSVQGTTEGILYKRNVNPNVTHWVYRKAFCRALPLQYSHRTITKHGVNAFWYKPREGIFDTPEENPDNFCFTKEGTKSRMASGLSPVTPCYYGFPIAISYPHFNKADPKLRDDIEGMHPDASIHDSSVSIQPDLGMLLTANVRLQVNVVVFKTRFIPRVSPFNNMVVPLFWIDYNLDVMNGAHANMLMRLALVIGPFLEVCFVVFLCLTGLIMVTFAILGRRVELRGQRKAQKREPDRKQGCTTQQS